VTISNNYLIPVISDMDGLSLPARYYISFIQIVLMLQSLLSKLSLFANKKLAMNRQLIRYRFAMVSPWAAIEAAHGETVGMLSGCWWFCRCGCVTDRSK
jgi:hypothetical protein